MLVTAPVWVPIEYGISQSSIVQPVEIVTDSGSVLSPPFQRKPETRFIVTKDAIVCKGRQDLAETTQNGVRLTCNKGLKGRVSLDRFTVRRARITIGPKSTPEKRIGVLSNVLFSCEGKYNVKRGRVDPLLLTCPEKGFAVISPTPTDADPQAFTVWLYPPR